MGEVLKKVKGLQINEGDACLTCRARAQSVLTRKTVRMQHGRSVEVGLDLATSRGADDRMRGIGNSTRVQPSGRVHSS